MAKCKLCKTNEAEWAMQYIGEDTPSFYTLGSHIRGFRVTKVCGVCREKIRGSALLAMHARMA